MISTSRRCEIARLQEQVNDPGFYNRPYDEYNGLLKAWSSKERELSQAVARWAELEEIQEVLQKS